VDLSALVSRIDDILSYEEFARDLAGGLSLIAPDHPDAELDAMVNRVKGRFESSRNYEVVLRFLQDHSRLTDREIAKLLEFIYSKLVNKFKGELGEVLAARTIFEFGSQLGADITVLHGSWLSARQLRRSGGWYDAADALYCKREGNVLDVVAIAEVKSKSTPLEDMRNQVAKNIQRLRRGLRLRGEEIPPERIRVTANGRTVAAVDVDEDHARAVTALLIVPQARAENGASIRDPAVSHLWHAELPYEQDVITEAAYRFTSWYFSGVGPKVFYYLRDGKPAPGDLRVPAPHQDLPLEENGGHAFMEAVYHTALRKAFDPHEKPAPGRRTAWQTLLWIYNSMGFGWEKATADEFMFPEFTADPRHEAWLQRHNAAMSEYRAGRIAAALELFPDPAQQDYGDWAPREWMLLARLRARIGDTHGAREALANLRGDPSESQSLSTRMEYAAVQALLAIAGHSDDAPAALRRAIEVMTSMRNTILEHRARGWGFPADMTRPNAHAAVIDIAVAQILTGDPDGALETLLRLRDVDPATVDLLGNDPVLSIVSRNEGVFERLRETITRREDFAIF
jgi:hypothetical protein